MKTIFYFALLSIMFIGCKNSKNQSDNAYKQDIADITTALYENNIEKIINYLPTQDILNNIPAKDEQHKKRIQKKIGANLKYGNEKFISLVRGSEKKWDEPKPIVLYIKLNDNDSWLKDTNAQTASIVFSMKDKCYELELFIIKQNNKNFYTFKKEVSRTKDCNKIKKHFKTISKDELQGELIFY